VDVLLMAGADVFSPPRHGEYWTAAGKAEMVLPPIMAERRKEEWIAFRSPTSKKRTTQLVAPLAAGVTFQHPPGFFRFNIHPVSSVSTSTRVSSFSTSTRFLLFQVADCGAVGGVVVAVVVVVVVVEVVSVVAVLAVVVVVVVVVVAVRPALTVMIALVGNGELWGCWFCRRCCRELQFPPHELCGTRSFTR
jgi:hypothetical protein